MQRQELHVNSSELLRILGPTNRQTGLSVTGGTATAYLLEEKYDDNLVAKANGSDTKLYINSATGWNALDGVFVWLDDGVVHKTSITGTPDTTLNTIDLIAGVTATAIVGRQVRKNLSGAGVTLTEYGTVKAPLDKSGEWGYEGIQPWASDLLVGQTVEIFYVLTLGAVRYESFVPAIVVE